MNWINADFKIPEMKETYKGSGYGESDRVLVFNGLFVDVAKIGQTCKTRKVRWFNHRGVCDGVTHWMPLPEPPR